MAILVWILLGGLVGVLAKLLVPGRDPGGPVMTILLGIAGAHVGALLSWVLGFGGLTGVNLPSIVAAIVGAVILLVVTRALGIRAKTS